MILREWSAPVRTADGAAYANYVASTGAGDYARVPGYLGHQILLREIGDGVSRITTLSWWTDLDAIRGFAGADPERARYYPEDEKYLLEFPETVEHHEVFSDGLDLAG